nr:glycosyltransferase [Streptococcus hyovaginalis]
MISVWSAFSIFWANIGYPLSILILGKFIKKENKKLENYFPSVTIMVVAHNEEKVIEKKLQNLLSLDYPKQRLQILVTSDHSDDNTNSIVTEYSCQYDNIRLHKTKERKGKINAQNEGARLVESEFLVMTDANAILSKSAIREIVSSFSSDDIAYVAGRLSYTNFDEQLTSFSENTYWDIETIVRNIESNIQTITAGNGALYAIRTKDYHDFDLIQSHDSAMPLYFSLHNKRAISNMEAIAYEKAGENDADEFKRKVRMARLVWQAILPSFSILNIFKYKWFTYFYLGHRTARYTLWLNHILLFLTSILLMLKSSIFLALFIIQLLIYSIAIFSKLFNIKNKLVNFISYYCMTVLAQLIGVIKTIFRKNKPFWEKAESTR